MKQNMTYGFCFYSRQKGVVLIIGLIMMLLLTIIGLSAIRGSNMQELMTSNMRDRNMAFQAAEAALRFAEGLIDTETSNCGTYTGVNGCFTDQNTVTPVLKWNITAWSNNSVEANVNLSVSKKPRYVIEKITTKSVVTSDTGGSVEFGAAAAPGNIMVTYRVTSLGYGGTEDSQVVLQSTFRHLTK